MREWEGQDATIKGPSIRSYIGTQSQIYRLDDFERCHLEIVA